MGGGFYDRTFAFRSVRKNSRPLLIGLAHGIQEVPALPTESWDMPVDMIATESRVISM
jgi:5-formyltetrahydrofolate cyclo-ligase